MKIRTAFVSNSSASSFIVSKDSKENTASVAILMIKDMIKDCDDYENDYELSWKKRIEKLLENVHKLGIAFDKPIYIKKTINYETYIYRMKDNSIRIITSRNHFWTNLQKITEVNYGDSEDRHYDFHEDIVGENKEMIFFDIESEKDIMYKDTRDAARLE